MVSQQSNKLSSYCILNNSFKLTHSFTIMSRWSTASIFESVQFLYSGLGLLAIHYVPYPVMDVTELDSLLIFFQFIMRLLIT